MALFVLIGNCTIYVSMYIRVVTPEHSKATYTRAHAHVYALHAQVYTITEFNIVIDICHLSSYHRSIIATLLIACTLTY